MIKMGSPQFMFMAEAEGWDSCVTTRQAKINAVIKEIRQYPKPTIQQSEFEQILRKHNLTNLSGHELRQIQEGIR